MGFTLGRRGYIGRDGFYSGEEGVHRKRWVLQDYIHHLPIDNFEMNKMNEKDIPTHPPTREISILVSINTHAHT